MILRLIRTVLLSLLAVLGTASAAELLGSDNVVPRASLPEVRMLLSGQSTLLNGVPVKVYLLPKDDPSTLLIAFRYVGDTPTAWFDRLDYKRATGRSNLPVILVDEVTLLLTIQGSPSAVGYGTGLWIPNNVKRITVQ